RLGFERGALEELESPSRHPPYWASRLGLAGEREFYLSFRPHMKERILKAGDMEFKQNKFLPAEKQVVTCNPDVNTYHPVAAGLCTGQLPDRYIPGGTGLTAR
ncbi:hypothetical protein GW17_00024795, partial [Ensete ventricosum]